MKVKLSSNGASSRETYDEHFEACQLIKCWNLVIFLLLQQNVHNFSTLAFTEMHYFCIFLKE